MQDEFSETYGPFNWAGDDDGDIGPTGPMVELLEKTYIESASDEVALSQAMWRPSLVARSDAELYDIESPRWAKRVHVAVKSQERTAYLGFLDIRALNRLQERLKRSHDIEFTPDKLTGSHLICGACLAPPERLQKRGYHFPTSSQLGVYHNELNGWNGTAFASPMEIWGGLCSQACVYMAAHSLIEHGARVLGISDITLAATGRGKNVPTGDYPIEGLTIKTVTDVLRSKYLGLHAFRHRLPFALEDKRDPDPKRLDGAARTMACYLSQGFPVILAVRVARLVEANRDAYPPFIHEVFSDWTEEDKDRKGTHCILLVGYRLPTRPEQQVRFVYHDSFCRPYMDIAADKLASAVLDSDMSKHQPYAFECVVPVPRSVGTPLTEDIDDLTGVHGPEPSCVGLLASAEHWEEQVLRYEYEQKTRPYSANSFFQLNRVKPTTVADLPAHQRFHLLSPQELYDRYIAVNASDRRQAGEVWKRIRGSLPKSLWIEEFRRGDKTPPNSPLVDRTIAGFWAWSGETPYPETEAYGYQKPIMQGMAPAISIDYENVREEIPFSRRQVLDVRKPTLLEIGAITTFCAGALPDALKVLAVHKIRNVDLFAFQTDDLRNYYDADKGSSPLEVVSDHRHPEMIARKLHRDVSEIAQKFDHSFSLRGFATYFPEISSLVEDDRQRAVRALTNIIEMAGFLQTEHQYDTRFVEIVAGTRLYAPRQAKGDAVTADTQYKDVMAKKASREDKQKALLTSLDHLSEVALKNNVWIGIEVEPGLLPFMADLDDMRSLARRLNMPGTVSHPERIGFNIDCCHMHLCDIKAKDLDIEEIRNRIVHVHIGDIGPGHLSDLVTGVRTYPQKYHDWFDLFARVSLDMPRGDAYPDFSGCLSVELEACRIPKMIASAYHRTELLLNDYLRERSQRR